PHLRGLRRHRSVAMIEKPAPQYYAPRDGRELIGERDVASMYGNPGVPPPPNVIASVTVVPAPQSAATPALVPSHSMRSGVTVDDLQNRGLVAANKPQLAEVAPKLYLPGGAT